MTSKTSKEQLLGVIVHRAVLMPFSKPQALHRRRPDCLVIKASEETIEEAVRDAAKLLRNAIEELRKGRPADDDIWSTSLGPLVDSGGAWFSAPATELWQLYKDDENSLDWILELFDRAAMKVAESLSKTAITDDWKWMWSEVPIWTWGSPRPNVTRLDLLVGAGESCERGYAIDLKVTSRNYLADDFEPRREDTNSLQRYKEALEGTTFPVSGDGALVLLYADRDGNRDARAIKALDQGNG
jgi:hypothetical protein